MKSEYPKVYVGDVLMKEGVEFICTVGISPKVKELAESKRYNKMTYMVHLASLRVSDKHLNRIIIQNTDLKQQGYSILSALMK